MGHLNQATRTLDARQIQKARKVHAMNAPPLVFYLSQGSRRGLEASAIHVPECDREKSERIRTKPARGIEKRSSKVKISGRDQSAFDGAARAAGVRTRPTLLDDTKTVEYPLTQVGILQENGQKTGFAQVVQRARQGLQCRDGLRIFARVRRRAHDPLQSTQPKPTTIQFVLLSVG